MEIKVGQVWKNKLGDKFEIIGVSKESFAWKMDDGEIGCTSLKFWGAIQEPILVCDSPKFSAPHGWKLVPIEVDRGTALSMIIAAAKANGLSAEHTPTEQEIDNSWRFSNAVLAAAPSYEQ